MEPLTPRRPRLQSDSGAETVMSSELSRSPELAFFYTDGKNSGSCDFNEDSNRLNLQSSPLSSKIPSPTQFCFRTENEGFINKSELQYALFSKISLKLKNNFCQVARRVYHKYRLNVYW